MPELIDRLGAGSLGATTGGSERADDFDDIGRFPLSVDTLIIGS